MKNSIAHFLFCLSILSPNVAYTAGIPFESAHSEVLLAKIGNGVLQIAAGQEDQAAQLIVKQLQFFVGPLNGYTGGAQVSQAKITLQELRPEGDRVNVKYAAEFAVAWPKGTNIPSRFRTVLPLRADSTGLKNFFATYGQQCVSGEEPADAGSFFYFYRPERPGCNILQSHNPSLGVMGSIYLSAHPGSTDGKSPEYRQIWADKKLTVTFVVGTYEHGATSPQDAGIAGYNVIYQTLRRYFGNPTSINVPLSAQSAPGAAYPDIEMTFHPHGQEVNVVLMLIQKYDMQKPSAAFLKRFQERTTVSDLFAYNGHSDLGGNIRALSRIARFEEGKYQIFFVNGCDTFTYLDQTLPNAHAAVNPGYAASKHLDLITNSMPGQFGHFGMNAQALVQTLWERKATYRQMLTTFPSFQKSIVSGEEDNE